MIKLNVNGENVVKKSKYKILLNCAILAIVIAIMFPTNAYAAGASVGFGSNYYSKTLNETFPIGVYLNGDTTIGKYHVELTYDKDRLKYVSGADSESNGVLTLEGTGNGRQIKYWLQFTVISGGDAEIEVTNAEIYTNGNNVEPFTVSEMGKVPVYLEGEDYAAEAAEQAKIAEEERLKAEAEEKEAENIEKQNAVTASANIEEDINDSNNAKNKKSESIDWKKYFLLIIFAISAIIIITWLLFAALQEYQIKKRRKQRGIQINANKQDKKNKSFLQIKDTPSKKPIKKSQDKQKRKKDKNSSKISNEKSDESFTEELDVSAEEIIEWSLEEKEENLYGKSVIQVKDVCMNFKVSTSNTSGIKDYFIQKITRKMTYRELKALDHINFNVYKGEVVGIIGTNGSGKSTLLKIVSGALHPTSGSVITERNKIQLLTLGTGFDIELTAKENVYLNGSIIGYSKAFLDQHYDKIVEFAELQGFMEEKVKNFSSGMVSRLGFAIATVGDAEEILILDEVLSVGDEFFRKKSLARVKEMIHGGSTVLLVSHSINTIIENCTKVVWIEKGVMKMIGDPKEVCNEYIKQKTGE